MEVTVTGGTGFIGRRLVDRLLADGHSVRVVGRSPKTGLPREAHLYLWDGERGLPPEESLAGADAVVHLAGEPVAQRWTPRAKRKIRDSRVEGTRRLIEAFAGMAKPPSVLVSASAIGLYGSRGDQFLTEASKPGAGFLAQVCREWEAEACRAGTLGIRIVTLRIGVVLGLGGGALAQLLPPFKMLIGGQVASGEQWMSWIHLDDLVGLICYALETPALAGPVNATAPNPVRNSRFTRILARTLKRPALFTVPERALRLLFGEMAGMLLDSQRVQPLVAEKAGYEFAYPELGPALKDLLA